MSATTTHNPLRTAGEPATTWRVGVVWQVAPEGRVAAASALGVSTVQDARFIADVALDRVRVTLEGLAHGDWNGAGVVRRELLNAGAFDVRGTLEGELAHVDVAGKAFACTFQVAREGAVGGESGPVSLLYARIDALVEGLHGLRLACLERPVVC